MCMQGCLPIHVCKYAHLGDPENRNESLKAVITGMYGMTGLL